MSEAQYTETAFLKDGHSRGITSIVFNCDGSLVATSGLDGAVCVWHTGTWKIHDIYYAKTAVTSLAWYSETALVCGLQDGILSTVVKDGETLTKVDGFWAHLYPIEHLALSEKLLASGAQRELHVWHWQTNAASACLIKSISMPAVAGDDDSPSGDRTPSDKEVLITGIFWAPSMLIATYMHHGIRFTDTETWETVRVIDTKRPIIAASLSPNSVYLAISTLSSKFAVFDLESGEIIRKFKDEPSDEQRAVPVLFAHGGHAIVGGSAVGRVNVWFVESERKLPALKIQNNERVFALAARYDSASDRFIIVTGTMNEASPSTATIWTLSLARKDEEAAQEIAGSETVEGPLPSNIRGESVLSTRFVDVQQRGVYLVGFLVVAAMIFAFWYALTSDFEAEFMGIEVEGQ